LFDSHCHLDFEELRPDLGERLIRARKLGISGWFVPGCHEEQWAGLGELTKNYPDVCVGVGVHPYWSREGLDVDVLLVRAKQAALDLRAVAIGECGLDKARGAGLALQVRLFEAQLVLAGEMNLPVVVHQVGAQRELLECLGRVGLPDAGAVLHGFSGDASWGRALIERGFLLGIGTGVTKTAFKKLRGAVAELPFDSFLLETDAPDQAPEQRPGDPADLAAVRDAVADLTGLSAELVAEETRARARALFRLDGPDSQNC
jgi:TatD DNase family protein